MKRKITFTILFGFLCFFVFGQANNEDNKENDKYYFRDETADYDFNQRPTGMGEHYLGDDIAIKMYVLKDAYTYIEKGTPMSPADKTIVVKPVIYYSLKKLNNYYKKLLKKDQIEDSLAYEKLNNYILIGLSVRHQETDKLEEELREMRKPEDIESVLDKVVLNRYGMANE